MDSPSSLGIPLHTAIYHAMSADIISGVYPSGSRLPNEKELAKQYDVSRNTLRQALMLLEGDGMISKFQGRGNYVTYEKQESPSDNSISNPMIQFSKEAITSRETSYNFAPPSEIAMKRLSINASEILIASNTVYYVGEIPVSFAFVQIPVKYASDLSINLNDDNEVAAFTDQTIFEVAASMQMWIHLFFANGNIVEYLQVPEGTPLLLLEEILNDRQKRAIARCRLFFKPDRYDIVFRSQNDGPLHMSGHAVLSGEPIKRSIQNQSKIVFSAKNTPPPQGPPRYQKTNF